MLSQDTIVMRYDSVIISKVIEINQTDIKFKRYEWPDGPLYVQSKATIKIIKYRNGTKEEFEPGDPVSSPTVPQAQPLTYKIEQRGPMFIYMGKPLHEYQLSAILMDSNDFAIQKLTQTMNDANRTRHLGLAAIPFAAFAFISLGVATATTSGDASDNALVSAACFSAIAIPLAVIGISKSEKHSRSRGEAVRLYNLKY